MTEEYRGRVVHSTIDNYGSEGFGFVEPDFTNADRAKNVFFGSATTGGVQIRLGDIVGFEYDLPRNGKGPRAKRVWLIE